MTATEGAFKLGQRIDIPSLPNLRDIGGYATATGGRVRTGQLYRSTELNHLRATISNTSPSWASAPCSTCGRPRSERRSLMSCQRAPSKSFATC